MKAALLVSSKAVLMAGKKELQQQAVLMVEMLAQEMVVAMAVS